MRFAAVALSLVMVGLMVPSTGSAQTFGPQTPRDITKPAGKNRAAFSISPPAARLNLCNIHFHSGAEHRGPGFLHPVGSAGQPAHGAATAGAGAHHGAADAHAGAAGYRCNDTSKLTPAELKPPADGACHGVKPGDTIEVHWVHTSCATPPGATLAACVPDHCRNPTLRVEAQVFLLVNDSRALDFTRLDYEGTARNGIHQAKALPPGKPIVFRGSTTGPAYDDKKASPFEATWSVRPTCARLDINSLHRWCAGNVFQENHGHGVRKLVTEIAQLDEIRAEAGGSPASDVQRPRPLRRYCGGEGMYRNANTGQCEHK